ncbi:MAG: right-handed parallel beta-helix repeat-containing protein [bacterium]
MIKRIIMPLLVIGELIVNLGVSYAGVIEISGDVFGTWTTGNIYVATNTVTVPNGLKLVIEPAVTVKFATNTSLINYGTLLAIGTPDGTITFTSNKPTPQAGDWNSIKFSGDQSKGTISYCLIEYGKQAIYLENASKISIAYNTIRNNKGAQGIPGGFKESGSGGWIGAGIYLSGATYNMIVGNTIYNNQGGKGGRAGDDGGVGGRGGIGAGIYLESSTNNTISGNAISNSNDGEGGESGGLDGNGYGIYIDSNSYNNIIYTTNTYNDEPIHYYYGITTPTIIEYQTLTFAGSGSTNFGRIVLIHCSNFTIRNNYIAGGIGENGHTGGYGYSGSQGGIGSGIYLGSSTNIIIRDNTISDNQGGRGGPGGYNGVGGQGGIGTGIYLDSSHNNTITGNILYENQSGQGGDGGRQRLGGEGGIGAGIYLVSSNNNTVTDNIIYNNSGSQGGIGGSDHSGGIGGIGTGIYLGSSTNNTMTGNAIYNHSGGQGGSGGYGGSEGKGGIGTGIYLDLSNNNIIKDSNTIIDNTGGTGTPNGNGVGIHCKSSLISELIYNNIYNNQTYNLQTDILSGTQTAEYNWWGSDPPATYTFSGNIDYEPWLPELWPVGIITVSPISGTVGTFITLKGIGYESTECVQIDFGTILTITTITSDALGKFTAIFPANTQPYGTTSIIATGLTSGSKALVWFRIVPNITQVLPTSGQVGSFVTVCGNGFGPTELIRIEFGTTHTITLASTTGTGEFQVIFTVDSQPIGTTTVIAYGLMTDAYAKAYFVILPSTILKITPATQNIAVNSTFTCHVEIEDVEKLRVAELHLSFNPNILKVIEIGTGTFPPDGWVMENKYDNIKGEMDYTVGLISGSATGSGILCNIKLKAIAGGTSSIVFDFDQYRVTGLLDIANNDILFNKEDAMYQIITSISIYPEDKIIKADEGIDYTCLASCGSLELDVTGSTTFTSNGGGFFTLNTFHAKYKAH